MSNCVSEYRVGKFEIAIDFVERYPEAVLAIMKDMIITRAECLYAQNVFSYTAFSPKFPEREREHTIPTYHIYGRTWTDDDGTEHHEIKVDPVLPADYTVVEERSESDDEV